MRGLRSFEDQTGSNELDQLPRFNRAVVVVAHPDDEVFCSGLILELKSRGCRVDVMCVTKGEGGPCGEHPREKLGVIREREMRRSCDVLGITDLIFLGHVDPIAVGFKSFAPEVSSNRLANEVMLNLSGADLVISHGSSGEYWHPANLLVFTAIKEIFDSGQCAEAFWMTFLARQPDHPLPRLVNWDDAAFLSIYDPRHQEKRLRSLACHESQLGLFGQFADGDFGDFIRKTCRESYSLQHAGGLEIPKSGYEGEG